MASHVDLKVARAVCEAATDGPWHVDRRAKLSWWIVTHALEGRQNWPVTHIGANHREATQTANAAFIAAAREGWPTALNEIERARTFRGDIEALFARLSEAGNPVARDLRAALDGDE